jgi:hypothetical protein
LQPRRRTYRFIRRAGCVFQFRYIRYRRLHWHFRQQRLQHVGRIRHFRIVVIRDPGCWLERLALSDETGE